MPSVLRQIWKGMRVRDLSGAEIGTVEFVHLTDEDPSTPGPDTAAVSPAVGDDRKSLIDFTADTFRTDDVPETLRGRLLRRGFIRIDAGGLFASDRYVMPDQIASVSDDEVRLSVGKDQLMTQGG